MIWLWPGFIGFVLAMLALGLLFSVFVCFGYGGHWFGLGYAVDAVDGVVNDGSAATVKHLTGYVVEKSLSVDNIFVITEFHWILYVFGVFLLLAGLKMLISPWLRALLGEQFTFYLLAVILFVLAAGVVASLAAATGGKRV